MTMNTDSPVATHATAHIQHTCDGFGGQREFWSFWSFLERFGAPIGDDVFSFGFCDSLLLRVQWHLQLSLHETQYGSKISQQVSKQWLIIF
jgi:hypothetical protein